jgi:hypothetical protein
MVVVKGALARLLSLGQDIEDAFAKCALYDCRQLRISILTL